MNPSFSRLEMIKMFYAFNSWATGQLIKSLAQLSEEEWTDPGCSGNGSTRETLAHLLGTQWGWFSWFDNSLSVEKSIALRVHPEEISTLEKLADKWQQIDRQTHSCLEKLSENGINENWSATLPNGFSMTLPLWQLLLHVANHGTHTRAQIIAAIRRFGYDPGSYEFFRFALSQK
ncbi:MAG: DinB family protein [bacterium]|nr:MAG: DinB family protein [bacterium]